MRWKQQHPPSSFSFIAQTACHLSIFLSLLFAASIAAQQVEATLTCDTSEIPIATPKESTELRVPDDCSLVMAESSIPDSGWGVFSLRDIPPNQLVSSGDPVIQIPDPHPQYAHGMRRLLWDYLWDGQETGGQYEGRRVMSSIPGVAMLANGHPTLFNVLPSPSRQRSNAGLTRVNSPGAGASTHYHNFSWYSEERIPAGTEIFVNYGVKWFQERGYSTTVSEEGLALQTRSVSWLREHGYCLDNMYPELSTVENAGHGAFAKRSLAAGAILAPVPVLPVSSMSLTAIKQHESGTIIMTDQLLRNYCFGNRNSSLLLYPYSSFVNFINHNSDSPNLRLQWADSSNTLLQKPVAILHESSSSLLLELIATRPIEKGEELFLDYGRVWEEAWESHVGSWEPSESGSEQTITSVELNRSLPILRTSSERQERPYPEHAFTSCYYRLADIVNHRRQAEDPQLEVATTTTWKHTKGVFDSRNLRPCSILQRKQEPGLDGNAETKYVVQILNRPGLSEEERLPRGSLPYIVEGVPRRAILFSNKLYTTDQHLEGAFRHEIGLGDDLFPSSWMDLLQTPV